MLFGLVTIPATDNLEKCADFTLPKTEENLYCFPPDHLRKQTSSIFPFAHTRETGFFIFSSCQLRCLLENASVFLPAN